MTVVDVMLHKWRMLDDRRRRNILGLLLIGLALVLLVVWASTGSAPADPLPVATSTTSAPPSSRPALAMSDDQLILGSLRLALKHADKPVFGPTSVERILWRDLDGSEAVELELSCGDSCALLATFSVSAARWAADLLRVRYKLPGDADTSVCEVLPPVKGTRFFSSPAGFHYRCDEHQLLECVDVTKIRRLSLELYLVELELFRSRKIGLEYENPASTTC